MSVSFNNAKTDKGHTEIYREGNNYVRQSENFLSEVDNCDWDSPARKD